MKSNNLNTSEGLIILERIDPLGNTSDPIYLDGRWKITTGDKSYFITNKSIVRIKVDLKKIQNNFLDNI